MLSVHVLNINVLNFKVLLKIILTSKCPIPLVQSNSVFRIRGLD